jgi:thioredoxin-like negative regulator of GroEL
MLASLCFNLVVTPNILGVPEPRPDIKQAQNLHKNGNYKDALEIYKKILTDKTASDKDCADALASAADCLTALNMVAEIDDLFESAVASHTNNYQLLSTAADRYIKTQHRGYIIAGKFQRGYHRGRAKRANS